MKRELRYVFSTDRITYTTVETKAGKDHFVTGYISTPEIDLVNDIVTPNALKSMLRQLKSKTITLDFDHESFRDSPNIIPVGKVVDAGIDDRGLWVKALMNTFSPKFKDMWGSIKGGFITAFSIAFKPLKSVVKIIQDIKVRLLEDVDLQNIALTSVPVNPGATISEFGMKAVILKSLSDMEKKSEEHTMADEKPAEQPAKEEKKEAPAEEEKKEESTESTVEEKADNDDDHDGMDEDMKRLDTPEERKAYKAGMAHMKRMMKKTHMKRLDKEDMKQDDDDDVEEKAKPTSDSVLKKLTGELKAQKEKFAKVEEKLNKITEEGVFKSSTPEPAPIPEAKAGSMLNYIK